MKPRTVRKWDRAAAYIAWVSILLLGLGMLAVGLVSRALRQRG